MSYHKIGTLLLGVLLFNAGCSSSDDGASCGASGINLGFESCLVFEDDNELDGESNNIEAVVRQAVSLVNQKMSVPGIIIRIRSSPTDVTPEIGMGGYNPNEREVIVSFDPGFNNLAHSISTELEPIVAHEMHHAKRRRGVGYGATLFEAVITEGLADWFAMEVAGIDPPIWSVAVTGAELESLIETAEDNWDTGSYDHAKWFHGTTQEIPRWAGYSIGFKLVKEYLDNNPGSKPSELYDEPAESFNM